MERMCCEWEEDEEEDEATESEEQNKTVAGEEYYWDFYGGRCLLRLAFFRVERGQEGKPMATATRPTRSYEASWHSSRFHAQAFWI